MAYSRYNVIGDILTSRGEVLIFWAVDLYSYIESVQWSMLQFFLPVVQVQDRMATCHHAMAVGLFPLGDIVSVGIRIPREDQFKTGNRCLY